MALYFNRLPNTLVGVGVVVFLGSEIGFLAKRLWHTGQPIEPMVRGSLPGLRKFFYPLSPIHHSYICVRLTDGYARIFTPIPLFYPLRNKSSASKCM